MIHFIKKIFSKICVCKSDNYLPHWAHGLECQICKKTFISAQAHYDEVLSYNINANKGLRSHKDKIPVLFVNCKKR